MAAITQDLRTETQQVEARLGDRLVQQAVRHNIALQEQSARYDDRDDRIRATLHEMMQIIETLVNGRAFPVAAPVAAPPAPRRPTRGEGRGASLRASTVAQRWERERVPAPRSSGKKTSSNAL